jgi:hypothetical protein
MNWWHGRDALHAGAFVLGGRAWAVIGAKGQGKSTTLSYLATHGVTVLSDDLLVAEGGDVLPGPAFIDLRPQAAAALGIGRDMGMLGARERYRFDVPVPPPRVPLAGWLLLEWGQRTELRPMPVADRLARLFSNRAVMLAPAAPAAFLHHAALPFFELRRPNTLDSLPTTLDLLRAELG